MKERVLFLHHNAVVGGAELHLASAAKYFSDSSTVFLLADGPLRGKLEKVGVQVRIAPTPWARGGRPRLTARSVADVLKMAVHIASEARTYDLIYANSPKAMRIASLAGWFARRPVLWAFHDLLDPSHFSHSVMRQMVKTGNWGATRIVACSAASAASLIREGGSADRIHVMYQGIDPALFRQNCETPSALRRKLGLPEVPIAGVFGRITSWKGQLVAIDMLAQIPDLLLLIIGDIEEATYAKALRCRARELKIVDRVRLLGYRDDVPDLLRVVDVALHTSVAPEPFGRVIVEAMMAGRPIVASASGGVSEIIVDGVTGMLVPPGNADALATAVSGLLRDPIRARALAAAGCQRARTHFNLYTMLESLGHHVSETARR